MSHNFLFYVFGGISSGLMGLCLLLKWHIDGHRPHDLAWATAILSYSIGVVIAAGQYDLNSPSAGVIAVLLFWVFAAAMIIGNLSFAGRRTPVRAIAAFFAAVALLSVPLGLHLSNSMPIFTTIAAAIFVSTGWHLRKLPSIGYVASAAFFLRAAFLLVRPLLPDGIDRAPLALSSNVVTMTCGLLLLFGSVLRSRDLLREHEVALKEALRRVEASMQAKQSFIANMSHELRTPLNAVLGFTELIQSKISRQPDLADINNYAACANQGGMDMLRKVDRILEFVDIDDSHDVVSVPFDPADAVREEVALQEARLKEKGLSLHLDVPPSLSSALRGDERLFRIIVRELLANAIKAAPPQSEITVAIGPHGNLSRLRISDAGAGIPTSFVRTIGESFNVDGCVFSRGGQAQGLGLGLSLVTRYARKIDAEISFAPNAPTGTVAQVDFPFKAAV